MGVLAYLLTLLTPKLTQHHNEQKRYVQSASDYREPKKKRNWTSWQVYSVEAKTWTNFVVRSSSQLCVAEPQSNHRRNSTSGVTRELATSSSQEPPNKRGGGTQTANVQTLERIFEHTGGQPLFWTRDESSTQSSACNRRNSKLQVTEIIGLCGGFARNRPLGSIGSSPY